MMGGSDVHVLDYYLWGHLAYVVYAVTVTDDQLRYLITFHRVSKFHNNVHIFKTRLRNFLITDAFYCIDEYISTKHV
jgi:hypothetical protein